MNESRSHCHEGRGERESWVKDRDEIARKDNIWNNKKEPGWMYRTIAIDNWTQLVDFTIKDKCKCKDEWVSEKPNHTTQC